MSKRVTSCFCQAATAANPTAIPAFPVFIGQDWDDYQNRSDPKNQQANTYIASRDKLIHSILLKMIVVERPDIFKVVIRKGESFAVQSQHQFGNQKGKSKLEKHNRKGP